MMVVGSGCEVVRHDGDVVVRSMSVWPWVLAVSVSDCGSSE